MNRRIIFATLAALLTLAGCQTVQTTGGGAVGVERTQRMSISSAQINAAAEQSYAQTMQEAAAKGVLNRDPNAVNRVRAVASRLIPATAAFRADAPGWRWEVNVLSSPEINAWCMPGGKIAVYTGLLEKLALSNEELAAVMGHEIAHALREHARERMGKSVATDGLARIGSTIAAAAFGINPNLTDFVARQGANLLSLKFSRDDETEADLVGMELAARAGYNPESGVSLWQKMSEANKGAPPQWLSTHPSGNSRIQEIQANLPKVMPLYERAKVVR